VAQVPVSFLSHASHYRYNVPKSGDACVIEPGVTCNHCGYCESHGH
jgi:threonine dehydrogenase-like Zn-dependent dehydrogenase